MTSRALPLLLLPLFACAGGASTDSSSSGASSAASSSGSSASSSAGSSTGSGSSSGTAGTGTTSGSSGTSGTGCDQTFPHPATDPTQVCFVHCASTQADSDAYVDLAQTAYESGMFTAHVVQTTPEAVDMQFAAVSSSWSGHFYNFEDDLTLAGTPLYFHMLASGPNSIANFEVFADQSTEAGGPVNVSQASCTTLGN